MRLVHMVHSFLASAFTGAAMPLELTWTDLALRLGCTLIAGAIIGYNRGEQGKAAGLRTTILVCLAASVAMLQMNLLLPLAGRPSDSFISNDLMRLPLGILTGVGFIGGGTILRRGSLVTGVTTAATLWYVTVVGLCFGGGQMLLGWGATMLGCVVLWGLKWAEDRLVVEQHARLAVTIDESGPGESEMRQHLAAAGIEVRDVGLSVDRGVRTYLLSVREQRRPSDNTVPAAIEALSRRRDISVLKWRYFE